MGMTGRAFDGAAGSCFSVRIRESIEAGEGCAQALCERVRGNPDPDLLAALRQTFQFFLKGAISLHRQGRREEFWKNRAIKEAQNNFCAQLTQVSAVIMMARFLEETKAGIDWSSVAQSIPSEVKPGKSIPPCVARQYAAVFAHSARPDRVLVAALPRVVSAGDDLRSCLDALGVPRQVPEVRAGAAQGERLLRHRVECSLDLAVA